nr:immunoglobulin heavy chain junction region [Mus musculus]
CTRRYFDVW